MKTTRTITLDEFRALIARNDWQVEYDVEFHRPEVREGFIEGILTKVLVLDGITVTYEEIFDYPEGSPREAIFSTWYRDEPFTVEGVKVLDEHGEVMTHGGAIWAECEEILEETGLIELDYRLVTSLGNA
jgi:hypothetical protein